VSGQLDKAVEWKKKSVSIDPGHTFYRTDLGFLYLDLGDPGEAEGWMRQASAQNPEGFWPNLGMQWLHAYQGDETAALDYGRRAFAINPRVSFVLSVLRDHELRAGRHTEARALYAKSYPGLLNDSEPKIDGANYRAAIDLALVLSKTGEHDRVDMLLNRSLQHIQTISRLGDDGYRIADVQIYALQGEKKKALSALRQAIDAGWRGIWWYYLKHDPILASIHDEPEFQAMVQEIEADMTTQLARLSERE
jgi:tetratricopeptide (TPR) repeat protein